MHVNVVLQARDTFKTTDNFGHLTTFRTLKGRSRHPVSQIRVDIWRDRCDRRSGKNLVNCVNFYENNAKNLIILPTNWVIIHNQETFDIEN